ncbi:DJ-1/PfpI family protein [Labrys neptuniae]|uniref:DJ-1/PfpI family protein n=1 Tax=Labrys neptuniae TaxID=376174 RepID=A0ABV3PTV8_9HYPH
MILQIGFLVFPKVQLLDLAGPFDAFAAMPGVVQHLIWKDLDPVMATSGWPVQPTTTLQDCPVLDVLCVPGGAGVNPLMEDEVVLDFLRRQAWSARFVTSVCTGSLVLGAAGLLEGKRATTHWGSHHLLEPLGAVPVAERIVADDRLVSGGGVTAGIDFALDIIARLRGREEAEAVQLKLEYAPAPPFDAGSPATAPAGAIEVARASASSYVEERERIVARLRERKAIAAV